MSRRKQSNPKPLKREDVWGSDGEEGAGAGAARSPASAASGGTRGDEEEDESRIKMEVDIDIDETPSVTSPPPRLRLNTSLATDPAQRQSSRDVSSPEDGRARSEMELLPGPAFPSAAGSSASSPSSSGMFCLPQTPEPSPMQTSVRVKQENLETSSPAPPPPPRQVSNCYVCQPCGIRFSSMSTLEAHQTYYCSHRPSLAVTQTTTRSSSPSTPLPGSTKGESDGEVGSPRSGGPADDESGAPAAKAPRTGRQYACPHCSYSADKKVSLNRHMRMHSAPCPPPSPAPTPSDSEGVEEGAVPLPPPPLDRYCSDCDIRFSSVKTYRAHKTHYCSTRHVVKPATATSPAAPSQTSSGAEDRAPAARGSSASSPAGSPPAGAQPFLALPTTPVLLVPYQLVQAASLISPHALPAGAAGHAPGACLLLLDGTVRPLTLPSPLPPLQAQETAPPPPPPPPRQLEQPQQQIQEAQSCASNRSPIPLDLSLPRSDSTAPTCSPSPRPRPPDPEDEKENRVVNTSSPSLCSSPASSPSSASPRPPRQNGVLPGVSKKPEAGSDASSSPARKTPTSLPPHKPLKHPIMLPELLGPLLGSHLAMLPASLLAGSTPISATNHVTTPQILVKQGVSRCAECNIVFCKMENYMAHKKHYCSARVRTDEASSPESGVATAKTASPSPVPAQAATTPPLAFPSKALLQYICAACGIKFTSFDNLKAHQTYYCPKRDIVANNTASTNNNEPPPDKKKCPKCKVVLPTDDSASPHQCNVVSSGGAANSWRCPCCGVSSPTATAAQKHLEEAHAGVLRAFRCTICRYRGNTLRGMRTHIRMHFTESQKSQSEVREEDFISCVLVGEPEPKPVEEEASSPEREEGKAERQHTCDQCNYSSNYKGNLVRHLKSVHQRTLESEDGGSPTPPPILSNVSTPSPEALVVKLEPSEEKISLTEDPPPAPSSVSSPSPTLPVDTVTPGPRYCKSCDISFSYLSTFIAHKKFYCSSHHTTPAPTTSPAPSPTSSPAPTPAPLEAST